MHDKKPTFQYVILIFSAILLIANIVTFDSQNDKSVSLILRVSGNVLVIIAMILAIQSVNKKPKN